MRSSARGSLGKANGWCVFGIMALGWGGCGTPAASTGSGNDAGVTTGGDAAADAVIPGDGAVATPVAYWRLPHGSPNAFQLPWPSDLTLTAAGFVDLRHLVNPAQTPLAAVYVNAVAGRLNGFSVNGAIYFRFSEALDDTSLGTTPVQLFALPESGSAVRVPIRWLYRAGPDTRFLPGPMLIAYPEQGAPWSAATRFAAVVVRGIRNRAGAPFVRDSDLDAVLGTGTADADTAAARALHAPAVTALEAAGIARANILSLAVFHTNDPTLEMQRAAAAVRETPVPGVVDVAKDSAHSSDTVDAFVGHLGPAAQFQSGESPYIAAPSGDFSYDAQGRPQVQRRIDIRFVVAVPRAAAPESGYPLVVYAPGTGGDAFSFLRSVETPVHQLLAQGVAVLSYDQVFIGERANPPTGTEIIDSLGPGGAFFNYANPNAGRLNNVQSAADLINVTRFARTLRIPAATATRTRDVSFDSARMHFFGHSQGSLTGPLALAEDDTLRSAMFSGAGGNLATTIVLRTEPVDIGATLARVLGLSNRRELFEQHPVPILAQTVGDVADPLCYAHLLARAPRQGLRAHSIFVTQGIVDTESPPEGNTQLARAYGLQLLGPVVDARYLWTGAASQAMTGPLRGNGPGGVTLGFRQYRQVSDGHFVVFEVPEAADAVTQYFVSAIADTGGVGTIR